MVILSRLQEGLAHVCLVGGSTTMIRAKVGRAGGVGVYWPFFSSSHFQV